MIVYKHRILDESAMPPGYPDSEEIITTTFSTFQKYIPQSWSKWTATVNVEEKVPNKRGIGFEIDCFDKFGKHLNVPYDGSQVHAYMQDATNYISYIQQMYSKLKPINQFSKMILAYTNNYQKGVGTRCEFKYPDTSHEAALAESKRFLGYRGTAKIEKKYNIPDKYCIQTRQFYSMLLDTKNSEKIVEKAKQAVKYIKDPDDVNRYFATLLRSSFMQMGATTNSALAQYPALKKLYNLYSSSYNGDDKITLQDLFSYVHQNKVNVVYV